MKSKIFILVALVAALIIIGGCFVKNKFTPSSKVTFTSTVNTLGVNWLTYTNAKYGYDLKYPKNTIVQPLAEEERLPVEESGAIGISIPGLPGGAEIVALVPYYGTNTPSNPFNESVKGSLFAFAQTSRQKFVDDKNPNFPDKKISELKEITFADKKAYEVTVTGYMDSHGGDTFKYVYAENGNYKLVIKYSLIGDLSKQIIDTFQFSK